jgi:YVTN family beta-propeller protein
MKKVLSLAVSGLAALAFAMFGVIACADGSVPHVGAQADGSYVVPTHQLLHPAGPVLLAGGHVFDSALSPDGKTLYCTDDQGVIIVDAQKFVIRNNIHFPKHAGSMHGIAVSRDGCKIYAGTSSSEFYEGTVSDDRRSISWTGEIDITGIPGGESDNSSVLTGIALSPDERTAYVCVNRNNTLGVLDLTARKLVKEIPVGIAPYDVKLSADGSKAYVSNMGGRRAKEGERTAPSSGSSVLVDSRGIPSTGTVSVIDLASGVESRQIAVGLEPAELLLNSDGRTLYVANTCSDSVSAIDTATDIVIDTVDVRPDPNIPYGSQPNALALDAATQTLYVADAGSNALAVVKLGTGRMKVVGFIPAGFFPGSVKTDGRNLFVGMVLDGIIASAPPNSRGWRNSDLKHGNIMKVAIPPDSELPKHTAQVRADSLVPEILRGLQKAHSRSKPVPVPTRNGNPSVFDHIIYVIKENKTYDVVMGDLPKGNGDPKLVEYGRKVTPNQHALAEQFVTLDNYYCNGVCSSTGHPWATQATDLPYNEKMWGGWTRSYSHNLTDCLAFSPTGLIWDNVLSHRLSFRDYGEGQSPHLGDVTWRQAYNAYLHKDFNLKFTSDIANLTLQKYRCNGFPGMDLMVPDVYRAEVFLNDMHEAEKNGGWPNLMVVDLPDDHTAGGSPGVPSPRAEIADNDLAVGKLVEGVSHSKFWKTTCIFITEDDPQQGLDHVDGHRSYCLVVSPYTKRGQVISQFYSQTSVVHTIEQMLGIPPMNQFDAMAPLMTDCFTSQPDYAPCKCLPNEIPLDEWNTTGMYYGKDRNITLAELRKVFSKADEADDDDLNRVQWYMAKGPSVPYPAEYAGAHGKGLKALGLELTGTTTEDEN